MGRLAAAFAAVLVLVSCGGSADPGDLALEYATQTESEGIFTGFRADLGWKVADVFVSERGDCAAVALETADGLTIHVDLANSDFYSVSEVLPEMVENVAALALVEGKQWFVVGGSGGPVGGDLTAWRLGRLRFGPGCQAEVTSD